MSIFKKGMLVKASDRENYGYVTEVNDTEVTVRFTAEDGSVAFVKFDENDLSQVANDKEVSQNFDAYNVKKSIFTETLDKFKSIGDVFVPAFGGIFYGGEDPRATSEMTMSVEDWIKEHPEVIRSTNHGVHTFEPITTGSIQAKHSSSGESVTLDFPGGVIPIFGTTGVGKSQLANWLTGELHAEYIRFGEPEIPSIHNPALLLETVHKFLNHPTKKVLIIDSFRPFFYMTTQKASIGKGGINNALYMDFTALSSIATWAGKTIFVIINPLATSKDDIETTKGNLESSTMGLIHVTGYGKFTYVARTIENKREAESYSVSMTVVDKTIKKKKNDVELEEMKADEKLNYEVNAWNKIFSGIQSVQKA